MNNKQKELVDALYEPKDMFVEAIDEMMKEAIDFRSQLADTDKKIRGRGFEYWDGVVGTLRLSIKIYNTYKFRSDLKWDSL